MSSSAFHCPHCRETFQVDVHVAPEMYVKCPHCLVHFRTVHLDSSGKKIDEADVGDDANSSKGLVSDNEYRYPPGFVPEPPPLPDLKSARYLPDLPKVARSSQTRLTPKKASAPDLPQSTDPDSLLPSTTRPVTDHDRLSSPPDAVAPGRDRVEQAPDSLLPPKAGLDATQEQSPSPPVVVAPLIDQSGQAEAPSVVEAGSSGLNDVDVQTRYLADNPEAKRRFRKNLLTWIVGTLILGMVASLLASLSGN